MPAHVHHAIYVPAGRHDLDGWFAAQRSKSRSMLLLAQIAQQAYGDVDVEEAIIRRGVQQGAGPLGTP